MKTEKEPRKAEKGPSRVAKRGRIVPEDSEYPASVPQGATYFRLRKEGRNGPMCKAIAASGAERTDHDIRLFTTRQILERWGHCASYWVQFARTEPDGSRVLLGGFRNFGLPDPSSVTQIVEAAPASAAHVVTAIEPSRRPVDSAFAGLLSLKEIVDKDAQARVSEARINADAALQSTREANASSQQMFFKVLEMFAPRASTGPDAATQAILAMLVETQKENRALLGRLLERDDPEPDAPEDSADPSPESDDERVERILKEYKRHGVSAAVAEYLGEETVSTLVRILPKIKHKVPELVQAIGPRVKAALESALELPPAPAKANGAPTQAPPAALANDGHEIRVS